MPRHMNTCERFRFWVHVVPRKRDNLSAKILLGIRSANRTSPWRRCWARTKAMKPRPKNEKRRAGYWHQGKLLDWAVQFRNYIVTTCNAGWVLHDKSRSLPEQQNPCKARLRWFYACRPLQLPQSLPQSKRRSSLLRRSDGSGPPVGMPCTV